ncbi:MAG TPA: aminotransferase class I/II-fold pyridoxal phosphate-dependent enzyme, partial [Kofleriaceae bacterium]
LEAGDEVVLLEPAYDTYAPVIRRLGAIPRPVRLVPPTWSLPRAELAAAFSPATKLLVLNSPMNPSGKVFTADELAFLAGLVQQHDAIAVCDEVYEHLVFGDARHIPLMTLPGMRDRTVRIGSAGKTFSLTGWKIGYLTAPPALMRPITKAHQFTTFTTAPNLQHAVALGLGLGDDYFAQLAAPLARGRDRLRDGLAAVGLPALPCDGTYFLVLDATEWMRPDEDDDAFCRRLVLDAGVALIPMSAFYASGAPRHLVRACFCKADATIDAAIERLGKIRGGIAR